MRTVNVCYFSVVVFFGMSFFDISFTQEIAESFQYPLKTRERLTQDFGVFNNGFRGYHLGEDIVVASEFPVFSPAAGMVKHARSLSGFGYVVVIEHRLSDGSKVCSILGHLRRRDLISEGAKVSLGEVIGYLSSDKNENGGYDFTHLHFGMRRGPYDSSSILIHRFNASQNQWEWHCTWRYLGYTRNANTNCSDTDTNYDISHEEMLSQWVDPSDFVDSHQIPTEPTFTLSLVLSSDCFPDLQTREVL